MRLLFASCGTTILALAIVDCVGDSPDTSAPATDGGGADTNDDTFVANQDSSSDGSVDGHLAEVRWSLQFDTETLESPSFQTASDGSSAIAGLYTMTPKIGTAAPLPQPAGRGLFVGRLDPKGVVVWVKTFDMPDTDPLPADPSNISIGDDGHVYLAGDGANYKFVNGVAEIPTAPVGGGRHGFIVRFAPGDGTVEGITLLKAQTGGSVVAPRLSRAGNTMIVAGGFRGTIDFDDTATKTANAICMNSIICGLFAASFDGTIPAVNWVTSGTVANATDNGSVHDVDFQDDIALVASFTGDSVAWQGGKTAPAVGFTGAADVLLVKLASSGGATWLASHGDPSGSDAGAPSGASRVEPNNVVIAKDKTIVVTGDFNGRVKVGSTTLTATVSTGPSQLDDGYIAGFSANDGSGLWAKQVSGNDFETVPALLALSSGNLLAATRYRSGGIVVDNTLLATPAPNGAGLALLEYTTGGVLASATSSASMARGLGPRLAHLPNDGIGIAMAINGALKLGPLSITSGSNGTAPTTLFAGYTP